MYKLRTTAHELHNLLLDTSLSEGDIRRNIIVVPTIH